MLAACAQPVRGEAEPQTFPTPFSSEAAPSGEAFAPLPHRLELDPTKVALGKRLFGDPRLSPDGRAACSSCHQLDHGGANGVARSDLAGRPPVPVNVPSIFNAAFSFRFGWSGRFADIGQQLDFAMQSRAAMASSWEYAARALAQDASYRDAFVRSYGQGPTPASVREALALYSLSLLTPDARFDRHLRGELALSALEQRGYELFRDYGCASCHQGISLGGNMLQRFGVMRDYFAERPLLEPADLGLFSVTHRSEDRYVFRVPSLRNVARTAPYFHDASAKTLDEAVEIMAEYQLGRDLKDDQRRALIAFLETLTGELDGKPL